MLASSLLYWAEKRRARLSQGRTGVQVVAALSTSLISGLPLATLAMLAANRLLPETLAQRAGWEITAFFAAWLGAALHATFGVYRSPEARAPWRGQCAAIALLALAATLLNWTSTGDHPLHSLVEGQWAVAGVDAMLLLVALLASWVWARLRPLQGRLEDG